MIILNGASESLTITTTATSYLDFTVSYADITTTTFTPGATSNTIGTASTNAVLVGAPSGSTQRQIKLITLVNRDPTVTNTVVIKKLVTATYYNLTPVVTLLAGESMQYMDGQGWVYYSTTGAIKGSQTAAGSNMQIQYNSSGVLGSEADLTWDPSANTLGLAGSNTGINLTAITNEPSATSAGTLRLYSRLVAGRMLPKWIGPAGVDIHYQPNIGFQTTQLWTPANSTTATGVGFGTAWPACTGTITHPATTTGMGNQVRIMQCTNVVTTTNQILGLTVTAATLPQFWRGNAGGQGGFFFQCRWRIMLIPAATTRLFIGLASQATGLVASDTYTGDLCGFDHITTDGITTMAFATMDNSTRNRATFTVPTLAAGNTYDATIYSPPNGSAVYYRLIDLLTGTVLVDANTTTNMPRNTIYMGPQVQMSNGTANVTATTVAIGINKIYIESDM